MFDALADRLADRGDQLVVAAGQPIGRQALRGDQSRGHWLHVVPSRTFRTPPGEFKVRTGLKQLIASADVCVTELDAGNLNTWDLVLRRRRNKRIVLWGHGKSYTSASRRVNERLKMLQCRLADHVMTYSPSGREHLRGNGVPVRKITAVGNATDTVGLRRAFEARMTRPVDRSELLDLSVAGRHVACYVGGLDSDKRVAFLTEAARHAHLSDSRFLLLVAGSGSDEALLAEGKSQGYIAHLPHADQAGLADLGAVSRSIWMPGRVGLVAVDALALGLPVMTTNFPYHAPEYEFLSPGRDVMVLPDDPLEFSRQATARTASDGRIHTGTTIPTVEAVVDRMINVIDGRSEEDHA
ncbi:glycosyltransferase [Kineosporia sp. J2-2]|uniref:Glycosyltransferase n=1 Tax=Kineosporia corallincola TaxID=2835133 RepID=A0ABS5TEI2_9ACTN|nr:glycosyltransferase [Kineosporia corallincola]MBT0769472.1 glycosyltransferase [Kineosporia corallincola]